MIPAALLIGAGFDSLVALVFSAPLTLLLSLLSQKSLERRWLRRALVVGTFLFTFALMFLGVVEYYFFDEFNSRFNYVAVDYLFYPHEVFINIWDSYPVRECLIGVFVLSLGITLIYARKMRGWQPKPLSRLRRVQRVGVIAAAIVIAGLTLNINLASVSSNRVLNEIAANGVYSFISAFETNNLDYNAYYSSLDATREANRLRNLIQTNDARFVATRGSAPIDRIIEAGRPPRRMNVVLVLEESFGSEFVGSLHPDGPSCTPQFDSLCQQGLLFSRIYATGNRTVRGVEASLLSFPPIPGQAIVKRPGCESMFGLPSVLQAQGYQTVFVYGGRSYFDNFGYFATHNGFDRVIDQSDIENVTFSTIWGVCDEDLFTHSLSVFDSLASFGRPFFATLITVSNHKPYTYPTGRIPFDPEERTRLNAVRYADYALGKFVRDAFAHEFFANTLFVIVGDHGARVYGHQEMPMDSYEVPLLFYAPTAIESARRIALLGSQMDLAPTLLDFLHCSYRSRFFGRSLFRVPEDRTWALMSHNRDAGIFRSDSLGILGIQFENSIWRRDPTTKELTPVDVAEDSSLVVDAIAYYQTAYRLFSDGSLKIAPAEPHSAPSENH